jgi:hypothetical protein
MWILNVAMLSTKRKYEDENRGLKTEWKEGFVVVEINQIKYLFENSNIIKCILPEPHQGSV